MKLRVPEIFLGAFLAVAIFAMGMLFSSQYSSQTAQANSPEKSERDTSKKDEPKPFWQAATTDPVAAFTLGLLLVGIFQAGFFFVQLKLIRESLGPAEQAARAAKAAAEHIPRVERAYLFVTVKAENFGVILTEYVNMTDDNLTERIGKSLIVDFIIENQGKTPAIIKSVSGQMQHYKELPDEPGYGAPLDLPKNRYLGGGKQAEPIMVNMLAPTYKTVGMLMRAESAVWFYGRVKYEDIFGNGHEHRFCWRYRSGYFLPYYRNEKYIENT